MNTMRDSFEALADTPAPPSRLSADDVYAAAWRRRHRRTAVGLAGGVGGAVAVLLAASLGVNALRQPAGGGAAGTPPSPAGYGTVISAATTGADHLFAGVRVCPDEQCVNQLLGSDDAGATWSVRQPDAGDGQIYTPAPGVLMETSNTDNDHYDGTPANGPKEYRRARISTDGGRTWRDVRTDTRTVPAVAAGGWTACADALSLPGLGGDSCRLVAVDPATATAAPLANQPSVDNATLVAAPASAGIWVTGRDAGHNAYPVVAASHDGGQTWSVQRLEDDRQNIAGGATSGGPPAFATIDGVTAYILVFVPDPTSTGNATTAPGTGPAVRVYGTTDGGRNWQRLGPERPVPRGSQRETFLTADGTQVILTRSDPPQQWYASSGGDPFSRVELPGFGDHLAFSGIRPTVLVTGPGAYLAFDESALYRSTDGRHWTRTLVRPPR